MEQAGHGQAAAEQVGTAQVEVDAVITAHGSASQHDLAVIGGGIGLGVDLVQTGQEFVADVLDVLLVPHDAAVVVAALDGPGLLVHAANAEQLQAALLQVVGHGVDHAAALKVKELAVLAGEDDHGQTGVAVDLKLHVPVQIVGPLFIVTSMHDAQNSFLFKT